jgi:hypothetical protein
MMKKVKKNKFVKSRWMLMAIKVNNEAHSFNQKFQQARALFYMNFSDYFLLQSMENSHKRIV